jgi:hypothetical protein
MKLDAWLGTEGIKGGLIKGKETLCIEAGAPAAVCEVHEIADSDMESDGDGVGDSNSDRDGYSSPAPTPPPALR